MENFKMVGISKVNSPDYDFDIKSRKDKKANQNLQGIAVETKRGKRLITALG